MVRPRTEIGTYGTIKTDQLTPTKWRARTRYRFEDGRLRQIERIGLFAFEGVGVVGGVGRVVAG